MVRGSHPSSWIGIILVFLGCVSDVLAGSSLSHEDISFVFTGMQFWNLSLWDPSHIFDVQENYPVSIVDIKPKIPDLSSPGTSSCRMYKFYPGDNYFAVPGWVNLKEYNLPPIYYYDPVKERFIQTHVLEPGKGYLLKTKSPLTVKLCYDPVPLRYHIYPGWNLVGAGLDGLSSSDLPGKTYLYSTDYHQVDSLPPLGVGWLYSYEEFEFSVSENCIYDCGVINHPGEYRLCSDIDDPVYPVWIRDACIVINSSDVVLRGAGHTIHTQRIAVYIYNSSNVVVRDLPLEPVGYRLILADHVDNLTLQNITYSCPSWVYESGLCATDGIIVVDSNNVSIKDIYLERVQRSSSWGVMVRDSYRVNISNVSVLNSDGIGVYLVSDDDVCVSHVRTNNNSIGLYLYSSNATMDDVISCDNRLRDVSVHGNEPVYTGLTCDPDNSDLACDSTCPSEEEEEECNVRECTVLSEPGYYRLCNDLHVASDERCLVVDSDDVIIDGNGFGIMGDGTGMGVFSEGRRNLTVLNTRFVNLAAGVRLGGRYFNITQNRFQDTDGVIVYNSRDGLISNNMFSGYDNVGVSIEFSHNITLADNRLSNGRVGIGLWMWSDNVKVINNTVSDSMVGLFVDYSMNNAEVVNNTLCHNMVDLGDQSGGGGVGLPGGRLITDDNTCSNVYSYFHDRDELCEYRCPDSCIDLGDVPSCDDPDVARYGIPVCANRSSGYYQVYSDVDVCGLCYEGSETEEGCSGIQPMRDNVEIDCHNGLLFTRVNGLYLNNVNNITIKNCNVIRLSPLELSSYPGHPASYGSPAYLHNSSHNIIENSVFLGGPIYLSHSDNNTFTHVSGETVYFLHSDYNSFDDVVLYPTPGHYIIGPIMFGRFNQEVYGNKIDCLSCGRVFESSCSPSTTPVYIGDPEPPTDECGYGVSTWSGVWITGHVNDDDPDRLWDELSETYPGLSYPEIRRSMFWEGSCSSLINLSQYIGLSVDDLGEGWVDITNLLTGDRYRIRMIGEQPRYSFENTPRRRHYYELLTPEGVHRFSLSLWESKVVSGIRFEEEDSEYLPMLSGRLFGHDKVRLMYTPLSDTSSPGSGELPCEAQGYHEVAVGDEYCEDGYCVRPDYVGWPIVDREGRVGTPARLRVSYPGGSRDVVVLPHEYLNISGMRLMVCDVWGYDRFGSVWVKLVDEDGDTSGYSSVDTSHGISVSLGRSYRVGSHDVRVIGVAADKYPSGEQGLRVVLKIDDEYFVLGDHQSRVIELSDGRYNVSVGSVFPCLPWEYGCRDHVVDLEITNTDEEPSYETSLTGTWVEYSPTYTTSYEGLTFEFLPISPEVSTSHDHAIPRVLIHVHGSEGDRYVVIREGDTVRLDEGDRSYYITVHHSILPLPGLGTPLLHYSISDSPPEHGSVHPAEGYPCYSSERVEEVVCPISYEGFSARNRLILSVLGVNRPGEPVGGLSDSWLLERYRTEVSGSVVSRTDRLDNLSPDMDVYLNCDDGLHEITVCDGYRGYLPLGEYSIVLGRK